jgi:hypothetical protein
MVHSVTVRLSCLLEREASVAPTGWIGWAVAHPEIWGGLAETIVPAAHTATAHQLHPHQLRASTFKVGQRLLTALLGLSDREA